jgi:hypothetical protein
VWDAGDGLWKRWGADAGDPLEIAAAVARRVTLVMPNGGRRHLRNGGRDVSLSPSRYDPDRHRGGPETVMPRRSNVIRLLPPAPPFQRSHPTGRRPRPHHHRAVPDHCRARPRSHRCDRRGDLPHQRLPWTAPRAPDLPDPLGWPIGCCKPGFQRRTLGRDEPMHLGSTCAR